MREYVGTTANSMVLSRGDSYGPSVEINLLTQEVDYVGPDMEKVISTQSTRFVIKTEAILHLMRTLQSYVEDSVSFLNKVQTEHDINPAKAPEESP